MKIEANAKINLTLNITGILDNGYHGIDTIMQSVSISDEITINKNNGGINVFCEGVDPEKNTAFVAAKLFFEKIKEQPCVDIFIDKKIPTEAGMGGGSSDAAAVLSGLNSMFDNRLSIDEILELAVKIGADVPFCVVGGTARCRGIGEIISTVEHKKIYYVVILKSFKKPSTSVMYKALDSKDKIPHPDTEIFLNAYLSGDYSKMKNSGGNSFSCLWDIEDIINKFYDLGAVYSQLTGSGPCVFGIFAEEDAAKLSAEVLKDMGDVYICKTVN